MAHNSREEVNSMNMFGTEAQFSAALGNLREHAKEVDTHD